MLLLYYLLATEARELFPLREGLPLFPLSGGALPFERKGFYYFYYLLLTEARKLFPLGKASPFSFERGGSPL